MTETSAEQEPLSDEDCWALLRVQEFGRLAYVIDGAPAIVPTNYAVDGDQLVFRTTHGTKLHSILADPRVAFEIDHVDDDDDLGTSVVVRGVAHVLSADDEPRIEQVGLRAWLGHDRPVLVAIRPTEVTGRRYHLRRPWRHMLR